jgi:uncharacterized protein (TIGR03435 family)
MHENSRLKRNTMKSFVMALLLPMTIVAAPQTVQRPAFEVASIKRVRQAVGPYGMTFQPNGVTAHAQLNLVIANAYGISVRQLEGDSALLMETFDIDARATANFIPPNSSIQERNGQLRLMLQTLLAERFRLVVHKEVKDMPVYALVIAKGGPRLKPAPADTDCPMGVPCSRAGGGPAAGLLLPDTDMQNLANIMTVFARRIVIDRTGIQRHFEIKLPPWTPPDLLGPPPLLNDEPVPDANGASLFSVLEEQLGLRLQSTRASVDVFVVDHLERPTEN